MSASSATLKAECLDRYLFDRVSEAQTILDYYVDEYNRFRPHSSLSYLAPMADWRGSLRVNIVTIL